MTPDIVNSFCDYFSSFYSVDNNVSAYIFQLFTETDIIQIIFCSWWNSYSFIIKDPIRVLACGKSLIF